MRKIFLSALAVVAVYAGYKYQASEAAKKAGPFSVYAIDLTNFVDTNRGLLPLTEKLMSLRRGEEAILYVESLGFKCEFYDTKWKVYNSEKKVYIKYDKYASCEYWYGFWNEKIISNIYLDGDDIVLFAKTWVHYTEY